MWFEFHDNDGRSIFVNMDQATDFRRWKAEDKYTQIHLGSFGEAGRQILVVETPEEIAAMIHNEQSRLADLTKTAR